MQDKITIYIAEDHIVSAQLIVETLLATPNGKRYQFRLVEDGSRLIRMLQEDGNPDLLILDLMMDPVNGFQALEYIQKNKTTYNFPILVVTALCEKSYETKVLSLGADMVIFKPFVAKDLVLKAEMLIEKHMKQKEYEKTLATLNGTIRNIQYESFITLCKVVEAKDGSTGEHVDRVGEIAYQIAKIININQEICEIIKYASKLHDIGKVAIPDAILQKQGQLTKEEFNIIKTHVVHGANIIADAKEIPLFYVAREIILYHHKHFDGDGYPDGTIKGRAIPLSARITAVADVFDALTNERVYKKAWTKERAIDYIHSQAGRQFDPEVVEAFLMLW